MANRTAEIQLALDDARIEGVRSCEEAINRQHSIFSKDNRWGSGGMLEAFNKVTAESFEIALSKMASSIKSYAGHASSNHADLLHTTASALADALVHRWRIDVYKPGGRYKINIDTADCLCKKLTDELSRLTTKAVRDCRHQLASPEEGASWWSRHKLAIIMIIITLVLGGLYEFLYTLLTDLYRL